MPEPIKVSFNQPFHRAVEEIAKRGIVLPSTYYAELLGIHRQLNFSIAGKASLDQLQAVLDSLEEVLQKGSTFEKWRKDIRVQDLGLPKHRLDNIFRTNIQAAYNRGHWENFTQHKNTRPYLMYDAINDTRVRPTHLAMDGIIRPVGDPFWATHYPPNGYRCRCRCISLTDRQARERSKNGNGLNKPITDEMKPDKGFDYNVGQDLTAGVNKAFDESISKIKSEKLKDVATNYKARDSEMTESFLPAKAVKDAEKYLVENNIVDHADFGKITDITFINNWNKALFETIKEFPELRVNQQFTGSLQKQLEIYLDAEVEKEKARLIASGYGERDAAIRARQSIQLPEIPNYFAASVSIDGVKGISFNEIYEHEYLDVIQENAESGYWAKGSDSIKYTADHELAHQLDDLLEIHKNKAVIDLFEKLKNDNLLKTEVSGYVDANKDKPRTNIREFIAECWAEYRNTQEPREAASIVGAIIEERYADRYKSKNAETGI